MAYEIVLAPVAVADLRSLDAYGRAKVTDALDLHLRNEPTKVSRSRIKRLRGLRRPQFRLRVDNLRVFYDVVDQTVEILAIVAKEDVDAWLEKASEKETTEGSGPVGSEG